MVVVLSLSRWYARICFMFLCSHFLISALLVLKIVSMTMPLTRVCRAFQDVLKHDLPGNIAAENAQLMAENARLQAEVQRLQVVAVSPYGWRFPPQDPRDRLMTWRDVAYCRRGDAESRQ